MESKKVCLIKDLEISSGWIAAKDRSKDISQDLRAVFIGFEIWDKKPFSSFASLPSKENASETAW